MAKKSQIMRDLKRHKMIEQQREKRAKLRKMMVDPKLSDDERLEAQFKLQKMPRNGAPTRKKLRCFITGRSHGVYRKFGISRIKFREMALEGKLPGITKASW